MSQIKSKDTKPEMIVRRYLHAQGFRYKLYDKTLPGKPDLVLPKYKTVVFVHGCFWHGHKGCRYFVVPKSRTEWWMQKINRNSERDKINARQLRKMGWKVLTVFECGLKKSKADSTLSKLTRKITVGS